MSKLNERQDIIGNKIFEDVIEKKIIMDVKTDKICSDLELDEEDVSNYFLGISKQDLPLGLKILNYLEGQENTIKSDNLSKRKIKEND